MVNGILVRSGAGPRRAGTWGVLDVLLAVVVVALALVVLFAGLAVALNLLGLSAFGEEDGRTTVILLVAQAVLDLLAVGVAALFSLRKYRLSLTAWGLGPERRIRVARCIAALIAAYLILALYGLATRALGLDALEPRSNVPGDLLRPRWVLPISIILVVVVAPLTEEIFFRGFVFKGLRHTATALLTSSAARATPAGRWMRLLTFSVAALVSGLLWASIHGQLGLVIPITLIGVLFAALLASTGSLWNAIIVHAVFNALGLLANVATSGTA